MKSTLLAITILSIISLNWTIFTAENGRFSVLSPAEMTLQVKTIPSDIGEIKWHTFTHHATDSLDMVFLYSITYYEYPDLLIPADSTELIEQFFDETLDAISQRINGEMQYSQNDKVKDYPARISRISYQDGKYTLKNKLILVDKRFYMIEVFSTFDTGIDYKINKFMDSFTLLD